MGWDREYAPTIKAATVHHTADSNDYTAADVPAIMRSIYALPRGQPRLGRHRLQRRRRQVRPALGGPLRRPGLDRHRRPRRRLQHDDLRRLDAGQLRRCRHPAGDDQRRRGRHRLEALALRGRPARHDTLTSAGGGHVEVRRGPAVTLPTIFAHRDVGATACPGRYGYSHMGEIRTLVAQKMADPALQAKVPPHGVLPEHQHHRGSRRADRPWGRG